MDKINVYSIRDTVAERFGPLFEALNDAVAVRNFKAVISKTMYEGDFILYKLAEYDSEMGYIMPLNAPQMIEVAKLDDSEYKTIESGLKIVKEDFNSEVIR